MPDARSGNYYCGWLGATWVLCSAQLDLKLVSEVGKRTIVMSHRLTCTLCCSVNAYCVRIHTDVRPLQERYTAHPKRSAISEHVWAESVAE